MLHCKAIMCIYINPSRCANSHKMKIILITAKVIPTRMTIAITTTSTKIDNKMGNNNKKLIKTRRKNKMKKKMNKAQR